MKSNGEPLSVAQLRHTHPRLRVDRLRTALRAGSIEAQAVANELADWITLFREVRDGAFRVLVLELLADFGDAEVNELLWEASQDRSDGVRLESLRLLCNRFPEEIERLTVDHDEDENLEVRVLLAIRRHAQDRAEGERLLLEVLRSEAGGIKERQALERVLGFFVEDVAARHILPTLREMREDFDDPEDFFAWAEEKLNDDAR